LNQSYISNHLILEIAFMSQLFSHIKEVEIIERLYNGYIFTQIEGIRVIKLLVTYNREDIYNKICNFMLSLDTTQINANKINDRSSSKIQQSKNKPYAPQDFVVDGIKYSLELENAIFLNMIVNNFKGEALLEPFLIARYILSTLIETNRKGRLHPYLDDHLRILENLCAENTAETYTVVELVKIISSMIKDKTHLNIFMNEYNPLKLFIILIKLLDTFSKLVNNMTGMVNELKTQLEDLALKIIDEIDSPGVLRKWLFDDFDSDLKIIDCLSQFNLLKILQHVKIDKTVEQLWYGNYDGKSYNNSSLIASIRDNEIAVMYRENHLNLDKFLSVISLDYPLAVFYWLSLFSYKIILKLFKKESTESLLFSNKRQGKAPTY